MNLLLKPFNRTSRLFAFVVMATLALVLLPVLPAQPVTAASGAINLELYACPPEVDFAGEVFGNLAAVCTTTVADEAFALQPEGGVADVQNTNASGFITWASSDPGSGTLTKVTIGSEGNRVFCSVHEEGVFGAILELGPPVGGVVNYSIPDDQLMDCVWFTYENIAELAGSAMTLQKWVCPDDFDAEAAEDLDALWAGCTTPGAEFPFARVPDGGDPDEMVADFAGVITWPNFTSGTGIVVETAAEMSLSRVFCTPYTVGEIGLAIYNEVDATGNQIAYDLGVTDGLGCHWFNYAAPIDYSDVLVHKRACPEGDWTETSLDTLSMECVDAHADVTFLLSSPSTGLEDATDAGGSVGWTVPSGDTYTISEVTPGGYGLARVFCSYYDQLIGPGEFEEAATTGNELAVLLEPGMSLECYWFNTPAELGVIVVDKTECPVGYGIGTGYDQLAVNCTTPVSGVTFTLTPAGLAPVEGQTDNTGRVVFENVPLGEGSLDELVPDPYNYVEVYCSISDDVAAGPYQAQNITPQNVMGYLMEPSQVWSCSWFNLTLEAGPASLTINKSTCQPLHDPVEPLQTLINECSEPNEDVVFTLEPAVGEATGASASTGTAPGPVSVEFTDLEAGVYVLTEEIPESVRFAYVGECRSDQRQFSSPFYPFAFVGPDGRFQVELQAGENVECDWFNVLLDSPGAVTIIKYWCQGDVVNEESCDLYDGGAAFTLVPADGGQPIPVVTGADGTATVDATGTFEVLEEDFEWCAAQSDDANAEGLIEVEPGAQVSVEIYNCGPLPLE